MLADQTGESGVSSSKNLWSIEECLEEWNQQQRRQHHPISDENEESQTMTASTTIQFVDATWFHKGERNGRKEFEDGPRLPGAFHWDTGDMSTSGELFPDENPLDLKNVFPPEWMVGDALQKMGLGVGVEDASQNTKSTTLVVYGREGTLFAPRVWYLLKRYYRCGPVKLLQGSLEEWNTRGGPVDDSPSNSNSTISARDIFASRRNKNEDQKHPLVSPTAKHRLVDKKFVLEVLKKRGKQNQYYKDNNHQVFGALELKALSDDDDDSESINNKLPSVIVDTRGSSFAKSGHIPGAMHLPYTSLSLPEDPLTLKPKLELEKVLRQAIGDDDNTALEKLRSEPVLLTCGTGVSVCTMALVLDELGFPEPWMYDGSWDEWCMDPSTPKEGGSLERDLWNTKNHVDESG
jgi:thiosulfate/3-mercaptopyruvate sulfurtransferase